MVEGLLEKEVIDISAGANHVVVITGNVLYESYGFTCYYSVNQLIDVYLLGGKVKWVSAWLQFFKPRVVGVEFLIWYSRFCKFVTIHLDRFFLSTFSISFYICMVFILLC